MIDSKWAKRVFRWDQRSRLSQEISATLCPDMILPPALAKLFSWIEANGHYTDTEHGRIGYLSTREDLEARRTDKTRPGGTEISFAAEGNVNLKHWFGTDDPEILNRLCVFANTGADGSMAAFWLAEDGSQKIVHLGSGSGSTMLCVLADDPIDFLRLLAIGYAEICWGEEEFQDVPNAAGEFLIEPNEPFIDWVRSTFNVTIPRRGSEIVKFPLSTDAETSPDPFWQWVRDRIN